MESNEVESGYTPSRDTRETVGFHPTRPHKAAGMRIEPPVSDPMAAIAMRSLTDTAAPEEEPPGMRCARRSKGFSGVPKCEVQPQPGIGELGHVGLADDDRSRGPQARNGRCIGCGGRGIGERQGSGPGDRARDIEQILDRYRQPLERPGGMPARPTGICVARLRSSADSSNSSVKTRAPSPPGSRAAARQCSVRAVAEGSLNRLPDPGLGKARR